VYGKIFEQMYDGTLRVSWQALITFQQMIVLCNEDGVLDMTPSAISGRTGIPIDIIGAGIAFLEAADPYSRTPDRDGRRIERLDSHRPWGWKLTNYTKYRDMLRREEKKAADRARIAAKRAEEKPLEISNVANVANVARTDATSERHHATASENSHEPPELSATDLLDENENNKEISNVAECRSLSLDVANVAHTDTDTEDSVTNVTAARAAPPDPKEVIWNTGVDILMNSGIKEGTARSFLGSLAGIHGDDAVAEKIAYLALHPVIEPRSWLKGALNGTHRPGGATGAAARVDTLNPARPDPAAGHLF
jgi:hypothetical protein